MGPPWHWLGATGLAFRCRLPLSLHCMAGGAGSSTPGCSGACTCAAVGLQSGRSAVQQQPPSTGGAGSVSHRAISYLVASAGKCRSRRAPKHAFIQQSKSTIARARNPPAAVQHPMDTAQPIKSLPAGAAHAALQCGMLLCTPAMVGFVQRWGMPLSPTQNPYRSRAPITVECGRFARQRVHSLTQPKKRPSAQSTHKSCSSHRRLQRAQRWQARGRTGAAL
jgi:hypothetical protein